MDNGVACSYGPFWHVARITFHITLRSDIGRSNGTNWLAYLPEGSPSLLTLLHTRPSHKDHFIPALLPWKVDYLAYWLIFAKDEPELFGRVITSDVGAVEPPIVCRLPSRDEDSVIYDDWLQFLERRWDEQLETVLAVDPDGRRPASREHDPLSYPVRYKLGSWIATTLPTHPWVLSCDDPQVLEEFQRLIWHD
ncbi:hypothetical protein D9613_003661 [Agrocybe pediades]|uniref:Uncharacterized protein n=1 Tax=Agrocybe pediades TaxID=84607 RepID=A0A8H4QI13_9AGAR|nr:hypothetical protein D9613_003661 [Agrocybe pediades]